jgi:hypothetical protein
VEVVALSFSQFRVFDRLLRLAVILQSGVTDFTEALAALVNLLVVIRFYVTTLCHAYLE